MRVRAALTFVFALATALATWSILNMMSRLDGLLLHEQVTFEMLLRGDVHTMYLLPITWGNVPAALTGGHWQLLLSWRPFASMLVVATVIVLAWRRRGWTLGWSAGFACLLGSVVPWTLGRVQLARIESPQQCGPWLAFMLISVLWGAVLAMVFSGRQLMMHRGRTPARATVPQPV